MAMTAKERRQKLKERAQRSAANKGKKGLGRKSVLNLSSVDSLARFEMGGGNQDGKPVQNALDHLPFIITQDWYESLREPSGATTGLKIGEWDYKLEYAVHRRQGEGEDTILCLNKTFGRKCPICEALSDYYEIDENSRTKDDEKMIAFLKPSWRVSYNVYNYNDPEADIHLWLDSSWYLYEQNLQEEIQTDPEGIAAFSDLEDGLTVLFNGKEKKMGKVSFYEAVRFKFEQRNKPWDEDIINETVSLDSLLTVPTYDEVKEIYEQVDGPPDDDDKEKKESSDDGDRERSNRPARNAEPKDEPNPDDTGSDDECPAGKELGKFFDKIRACQTICTNELYQKCAAMADNPDNAGDENPDGDNDDGRPWDKGKDPEPEKKTSRPERTRGGSTPEKKDTPKRTPRTRNR